MDIERLLREVESRLGGRDPALRREVLDAVHEAFARERRRVDPGSTVETERERRLEAETLREVLEAIHRHPGIDETAEEVLKQVSRLVTVDSALLALLDGDDSWRVVAVRGYPDRSLVGQRLRVDLFDEVRRSGFSLSIPSASDDPRWRGLPGAPSTPSWAGLPLLDEGQTVGLLTIGRDRIEPFDEEELHRVRALAFSTASALHRAQRFEQLRRYATLMERVAGVAEVALAGAGALETADAVLLGALAIGNYRGGLLVLEGDGPARIGASRGEGLDGLRGQPAPPGLNPRETSRLRREECDAMAEQLGAPLPSRYLYMVPVANPSGRLGTLVLLDPDDETPDDRLMESYASRAATALLAARRAS
ncbi:MAG TPA: GAF domain-containing protein [Vicinamibacteria bacterium]|nr:GAF domain-containing protein [Vicinamibacteria bacterium]